MAAHRAHLGAQARPTEGRPCKKDPYSAEKKATQGKLRLVYLDECGFSPSQPVSYSWTLLGERKGVPYENPQRRRVNVLAAIVREGAGPSLSWTTMPRTLKGDDVASFVQSLGQGLTVVVLDNAPIHQSKLVKGARNQLRKQGVVLYFLPPYSPELNLIEPVFGVIKHHDMPKRSYASVDELIEAVDAAFSRANARLSAKHEQYLRPAA